MELIFFAHIGGLNLNASRVISREFFLSDLVTGGLKTPSCARAHSFCGHAILQQCVSNIGTL